MLEFMLCGLIALGAAADKPAAPAPVKLIFDTDMGNDVDDALALGVIHALQSRGECELLAVTVTKDETLCAPYIDAVNTFYGRPDIPIGVVKDGPTKQPSKYTFIVNEESNGKQKYPHDLLSSADAPDATMLLRRVLAEQADSSVVIAQVGFSTNLARLLETEGDDYSPLDGKELAKRKVKFVSVMAGAYKPFNGQPHPEYNVVEDIPSAQKLTQSWPTPIIYSGFEIGIETALYKESLMFDYNYRQDHILDVSYRTYHGEYTDQPSWDLTAVLYAVRPDRRYFTLSPKERLTYDDKGFTHAEENVEGRHQHLIVDAAQAERVKEVLATLASQPSAK